jgi:hypothetical protein
MKNPELSTETRCTSWTLIIMMKLDARYKVERDGPPKHVVPPTPTAASLALPEATPHVADHMVVRAWLTVDPPSASRCVPQASFNLRIVLSSAVAQLWAIHRLSPRSLLQRIATLTPMGVKLS